MQLKPGRFFAGLLLITALLGLTALVLYRTALKTWYPEIFPAMLGFFFLVNGLFYFTFVRICNPDNNRFVRQFMLLFGVKLLVYLSAAVIVILRYRTQALTIALPVMVLYLAYTGYEVIWLTSLVKRKEQKR